MTVLTFHGDESYLQYSDDEYIEYLETIDNENVIFHAYYAIVRFSHIPDMDRNEDIEFQKKYIETGKQILRKYQAIYAFYDTHKLSIIPLCNCAGEIIKDPVYKNDLTEEGIQFAKIAAHWRESKSAAKNPPDSKYLARKLAEMRNNI